MSRHFSVPLLHVSVIPARPAHTQVGTNHLGHFLLANLLIDDLAWTADAKASTAAAAPPPRLVVTASPVHDPLSGGGNVGSKASLGDLGGLRAAAKQSARSKGGGMFDMVSRRYATPLLAPIASCTVGSCARGARARVICPEGVGLAVGAVGG